MSTDIRSEAAKFYDYNPEPPNDLPFYKDRIPSRDANVLELGCGTGRVTIPLSQYCKKIHGIDCSEAMLAICQDKLMKAGIPPTKVSVEIGDITHFDLARKFDMIIAPFRVFQNLETDLEVEGLFRCVRKYLNPQGSCILNVFNPNRDRETLLREWCSDQESLNWVVQSGEVKITCHDRRPKMDKEKLIFYPELIYRKYSQDTLVTKATLKIAMRCYYPEEFESMILDNGFHIKNRWGGYAGETYGQGPELIIEFENTSASQ